ncbi:MAG: GNAT family N-acetyltransferase [Cyanobacteria bacterium J06623_7]
MSLNSNIRAVIADDLPALKAVIAANDLFPPQMLDEMMSDYFAHPDSNDIWFTCVINEPVAIAYCAPEKMTEGTWNLYLIAVHPDYQNQGYGQAMMHHIEQLLAERQERILLVETSGLDSFEQTRSFYRRCGYEEEARIREFYQAGEDKIVFRKCLSSLA